MRKMITVNSREILARDTESVLDLPSVFNLEFDNGETKGVTVEETYFSRFYWEFHKQFDRIPILPKHHVGIILGDNLYGGSTHTDLCENIQETILQHYDFRDPDNPLQFKIARLVKHLTNHMTNGLTMHASPWVTSIPLSNIISMIRHPEIVEIKRKMLAGEASVEEAYSLGHKVLMEDPYMATTPLGIAYRGNGIRRAQCLQLVICRGVPTEADGAIFNWPILRSYGEGITDIAEYAADSRGAPKALKAAEGPIQESDFLSRRLKLVANVIYKVDSHDCGTQDTIHWYVLPETKDEAGNITQKSGLKGLIGRYRVDDDGELVRISWKEKELEGTFINLRDPLKCAHRNPHHVCRTCYGDMWYNVQQSTNIGFSSVAAFMHDVLQMTLHTKHHVASASGEGIRLTPETARYFRTHKRKNCYYFNQAMRKAKPKIILPRLSVHDLEKMDPDNLHDVNISKVTRLEKVQLVYRDRAIVTEPIVEVYCGSRLAFVTQEFLEYALRGKWRINEQVNYEIDTSEWDFDKPVFAIPEMELSFAEKGAEIGKLIESSTEAISERAKPESPAKTLFELYELVSRSLDMPLSCLSIVMLANSMAGPNDYRLSRGSNETVLGVGKTTITRRSMSNAYAFQSLNRFVFDARSFVPNGRPDSQFDVFFTPREVVERIHREA